MKVKALKRHSYAGKTYVQGTIYDIDKKSHIKVLAAVGRIEIINEKIEKIAKKAFDSSKTFEKLNEETVERKVRKTKARTYSRKDMTAENNYNSRSRRFTLQDENEKTTDDD